MCSGISPLIPPSPSNITSLNTTPSKGSPFSNANNIVAILSFPKLQLAIYFFGFIVKSFKAQRYKNKKIKKNFETGQHLHPASKKGQGV
jgi:hypothetical protein